MDVSQAAAQWWGVVASLFVGLIALFLARWGETIKRKPDLTVGLQKILGVIATETTYDIVEGRTIPISFEPPPVLPFENC